MQSSECDTKTCAPQCCLQLTSFRGHESSFSSHRQTAPYLLGGWGRQECLAAHQREHRREACTCVLCAHLGRQWGRWRAPHACLLRQTPLHLHRNSQYHIWAAAFVACDTLRLMVHCEHPRCNLDWEHWYLRKHLVPSGTIPDQLWGGQAGSESVELLSHQGASGIEQCFRITARAGVTATVCISRDGRLKFAPQSHNPADSFEPGWKGAWQWNHQCDAWKEAQKVMLTDVPGEDCSSVRPWRLLRALCAASCRFCSITASSCPFCTDSLLSAM